MQAIRWITNNGCSVLRQLSEIVILDVIPPGSPSLRFAG